MAAWNISPAPAQPSIPGVGLGVRHTPTHHHVKILATISSRFDPETLAACDVLAHLHAIFPPYMCGLYEDVAAVAAVLIGCHEKETIVIDYFFYTDARLR
jgi:hypothetical protein